MSPYFLCPNSNLSAFVNYFVVQEIHDPKTGRLLLGVNSQITLEVIEKLKNWTIDEICISQDKVSTEDLATIAEESDLQERIEAGKTRVLLKTVFTDVAADLAVHSSKKGPSELLNSENLDKITKAMEVIIEKIISNPTARLYIGFMDDRDPYLLRHSANVAHLVLNLVSRYREVRYMLRDREKGIGRFEASRSHFDPTDLVPLGTSCLLHDIGKVLILDLVNRDITLGPADPIWEKIKEHPKIGYQILFGKGIDAHALLGIKYHHENLDGTGYPFGLEGYKIHTYARMIRIADTFDAAISDRPGRKKKTPKEILAEMHQLRDKHFDQEMLSYFIDMVGHSRLT